MLHEIAAADGGGLLAIDLRTGEPRFQIARTWNAAARAAPPVILGDGRITLPIWSGSAHLLWLSEAGETLRWDDIPFSGVREALFAEPLPVDAQPPIHGYACGDAVLVTARLGENPEAWRPDSRSALQRQGDRVWEFPGWAVGPPGSIAIARADGDGDMGDAVAIDVASGRARWTTFARTWHGLYANGDNVVWLVDIPRGAVDDDRTATLSTVDESGRKHPLHACREQPVALLVAPHVTCIVEGNRLHRFLADGRAVGSSELPPHGPADPASRPALIAADHTHLLWSSGRRLVCEVLADPGRIRWELELPSPCRPATEFPARFAHAAITASLGHLLLHDAAEGIWCYGEAI